MIFFFRYWCLMCVMEEPVCTMLLIMVILLALKQYFLLLNLVPWLLLGSLFLVSALLIDSCGWSILMNLKYLTKMRIQFIAGGFHDLSILEMVGVLHRCIWQLVKDGLNACILCCVVELLFVLQLADMGNEWSFKSSDDEYERLGFDVLFLFCGLIIYVAIFAAVLGALLFI
jgi:hypothetical protein